MDVLVAFVITIFVTLFFVPFFVCIFMPLISIVSILYNSGVERAYKLEKIKEKKNINSDEEAIAVMTKHNVIMALIGVISCLASYILIKNEYFLLNMAITDAIAAIIHLAILAKNKMAIFTK